MAKSRGRATRTKTAKVSRPKNMTPFEEEVVSAFEGGLADLKAGRITVRKMPTIKRVKFTAAKVKALREQLELSQGAFAALLGTSKQTVSGWEQGRSVGSLASRFLEEINKAPQHFLRSWSQRIQEAKAETN